MSSGYMRMHPCVTASPTASPGATVSKVAFFVTPSGGAQSQIGADVAAAPSFDTRAVARALEEAEIGLVGRSTGIGDGLGLALKRLEALPGPSKVVVLLSDGANNAGQTTPRDVAGLARDRLQALGVRHIMGGEWCTVSAPGRFFSHRRCCSWPLRSPGTRPEFIERNIRGNRWHD